MAKQTHIEGPFLAAVFHSYHQGHAAAAGETKKGDDEASFKELLAIQDGTSPLNAGSTVIIDLNAKPEKKDGGEQTHFWPTYHFKATKEDGTVLQGDINRENLAIDGFFGLQGAENAEGVFQDSFGYRIIGSFDPAIGKCAVEITADCQDFKAGTLTIPWVAHA